MKGIAYRKRIYLAASLVLLLQFVIVIPGASAVGQSAEEIISEKKDPESPPADLTLEEWQQIVTQVGTYNQTAYLKASDVDESDIFGRSVAISGDTLVVGVYGDDSDGTNPDNNDLSGSGAAYVFVRSGAGWTMQAFLKASNSDKYDRFGISVAISGDTIVVGAECESSGGSNPNDNSISEAGAAYVFVRNGTTWTEQAYLKTDDPEEGDNFGKSVAISGDTIVVGAPNEGDISVYWSGAAYVFTRNGTTWTQQAYLKADNVEYGADFGCDVDISGDTIVVGAHNEDVWSGGQEMTDGGAAYVFIRSGTDWMQQAYLKASNAGEDDSFGISVAVSGDTIVVGAHGESSDGSGEENNSAPGAGASYVFIRSGTTWTQQAYLKAANAESYDNFGWDVDITSDMLVVGAFQEDSNGSSMEDNSISCSGAAYVFVRSGTTWVQQDYLKASNAGMYDYFGFSAAISSNAVVVGAIHEQSDGSSELDNSTEEAGAVYVFASTQYQYLPLLLR